jgi:hypothetical protein
VKVRLQNYRIAAVVNLKRLFRLLEGDPQRLHRVLAAMGTT